VQEMGREGLPIHKLTADKDKVSRAILAAVRMEQGKMWFPKDRPWVEDLEIELLGFPSGTLHDDQTDCCAYAAIMQEGIKPDEPPMKYRPGTMGFLDGSNDDIEADENEEAERKLTPAERYWKRRGYR
jgi:hypothetical protein